MAMGGPWVQAAERADVQDAALRCAKIGIRGLRHQKGRPRVRGEHGVPLLDGDIFESLGFEDAGVIDQQVKLAKLFDDR